MIADARCTESGGCDSGWSGKSAFHLCVRDVCIHIIKWFDICSFLAFEVKSIRIERRVHVILLHSICVFLSSAAQYNDTKRITHSVWLLCIYDHTVWVVACVRFINHYNYDDGLRCCQCCHHCLSSRCERAMLEDDRQNESAYKCGALYGSIEAVQSAHFIIQHCWMADTKHFTETECLHEMQQPSTPIQASNFFLVSAVLWKYAAISIEWRT